MNEERNDTAVWTERDTILEEMKLMPIDQLKFFYSSLGRQIKMKQTLNPELKTKRKTKVVSERFGIALHDRVEFNTHKPWIGVCRGNVIKISRKYCTVEANWSSVKAGYTGLWRVRMNMLHKITKI